MAQQQLWHDTIYDALKADVEASGGIKAVAFQLWPTLSPDTATTRLRNALNPEQAQKLDPEEVLAIKRIARDMGSTATVRFEEQALCMRVEWTAPEDEQARLQREFIQAVDRLDHIKRSLANNDQRLRSVR